ncbi:MAG: M48 family metallopeptidase [Burkholderiales bacterium]|nr:M48 family metallopeptidase [Burkholderiales bacterium]MBY0245917.1 M48 family metallopeptidase [Sphingobacteriaceae bacterium]
MNIETHQIIIGDLIIDVVRKDIKNLHLAVYPPDGRVRIAAPLNLDDDALRLFALAKLTWIKHKQRSFINQERQSPRELVERESHYFKGSRYLLRIIEHNAAPRIEIKRKPYIDFYVRPNTTTEQRQRLLNEWYRKHLKNDIPKLIDKWEQRIGVKVSDYGIKLMKTKWGTCNTIAKRIWINLELAKKPLRCLEYIIVHEMVHLLERRHNEQFKQLMDKFMPRWRTYKEELNYLSISS